MLRYVSIAFSICLLTGVNPALSQDTPPAKAPAPQRAPRPPAPTRDPHTPGYVTAKELPDGANAPVKADGNFILGPTHPARNARPALPHPLAIPIHRGMSPRRNYRTERMRQLRPTETSSSGLRIR